MKSALDPIMEGALYEKKPLRKNKDMRIGENKMQEGHKKGY